MFVIVTRYKADGMWHRDEIKCDYTTLDEAWREASRHAESLDGLYGSSHFWTVDLKNERGESYVQLFHGRLS